MPASNSRRRFPLVPLQPWVWAVPFALWATLLLLAFVTGSHEQSPHNPVPWWLVVVFGTALLPAGLVSGLAHRDIGIKRRKSLGKALADARSYSVDIP